MSGQATMQRHRDEHHETETIEELGTVTVYYGRRSMTVQAFEWCPICETVLLREVVHATLAPSSRAKWDEMKRTSEADERAARERARAYRDRRLAAQGERPATN